MFPEDLESSSDSETTPNIMKDSNTKSTDKFALAVNTTYTSQDNPTITQALSSPEYELWKEAICKELNMLKQTNCFKIVPRPPDVKVYPSKWLLKVKRGKMEFFQSIKQG